MKTSQTLFILGAVLTLGCTLTPFNAHAEDNSANAIKLRLKNRAEEVMKLKKAGEIGEKNDGFLQVLKKSEAAEKIVKAENNDRAMVYKAIAQKEKTTATLVGQRRAVQIVKNAAKGDFLQDAKGKWYQK